MIRTFILAAIIAPVFPLHSDIVQFENLNDGELVTTQYPGLTFTNTVVLSAGISLNEFEFPPHSGSNVASDFGGPIQIDFDTPTSEFSAYFTYLVPLTVTGFNIADMEIGVVHSAFSSNLALSGDPGSSPNELLALTSVAGISSITILGDPGGGSFTMDDVSFEPLNPSPVPEPAGPLLIFTILVATVLLWRRRVDAISVTQQLDGDARCPSSAGSTPPE